MSSNQAAWLDAKDTPLRIGDAPLPTAGPTEIVIKNSAIAINPVDWHMADGGVFVQQWPTILGCDVAGEVHQVGSSVTRFKPGDRVIAHTIGIVTGRPQDGGFALYSVAQANKVAILPSDISFEDGAVVPFALEAAIVGLCLSTPAEAMPGVPKATLGLPPPSLTPESIGKTIVVYGGSSSVGNLVVQLATASGIEVIATASPHNFDLAKSAGASTVFDHKDPRLVEKIVEAVKGTRGEFVGIFDAISIDGTYKHDLEILEKLGGGHLAVVHLPPPGVPENVKAGMIFAVDDIAGPIWEDFVTAALVKGVLKPLPKPTVVGHGLEYIQEGLQKSKAGVSGTKLVITL